MPADLGSSEILRECQDDTGSFTMCFNNLGGNSRNRMLVEISCYQVNMHSKSTIFSSVTIHLILTNQCLELLSKTQTHPPKIANYVPSYSVSHSPDYSQASTLHHHQVPHSPLFSTTGQFLYYKGSSREKKTINFSLGC